MEINGNILSTDNLRPIFDLLARDHADRVKVTDFVNLLRDHLNISDSDVSIHCILVIKFVCY